MKHLLPLLFFGILFSCTKPGGDDSGVADSTTAALHASAPAGSKAITLSPEETERVNFEIFLKFHNEHLFDGDPEVMAYKEEFTTNGNEFKYYLLRHNGAKAGWHTEEPETEYGEAESTYNNEIDTVEITGRYMAFSNGGPEDQLKSAQLVFIGKVRQIGLAYESYGELQYYTNETDLRTELAVELAAPRQLDPEYTALKAKIADLTEKDLAQFNKDELSYIRNEIFARHGHTFKTDRMITYFEQKDWYHLLVDDAAPLLNKFERRNVDFIKKREG